VRAACTATWARLSLSLLFFKISLGGYGALALRSKENLKQKNKIEIYIGQCFRASRNVGKIKNFD